MVRSVHLAIVFSVTLLLGTCSMGTTASSPILQESATRSTSRSTPPAPTAPAPVTAPSATATPSLPIPSLQANQTRGVATVVTFLDAYNAGQIEAALAVVTEDVEISDCDYQQGHVITRQGKKQVTNWLTERVADHDHLTLAEVTVGQPNTAGEFALGVSYARRKSDTLRALGFPNGIEPDLATKVIVNGQGDRILGFNNGPFGGSQAPCQPQPSFGTPEHGAMSTPSASPTSDKPSGIVVTFPLAAIVPVDRSSVSGSLHAELLADGSLHMVGTADNAGRQLLWMAASGTCATRESALLTPGTVFGSRFYGTRSQADAHQESLDINLSTDGHQPPFFLIGFVDGGGPVMACADLVHGRQNNPKPDDGSD